MSIKDPLEFQFTLDPEMSESDIEQLWINTQKCQNQFNDFLSGNCSVDDFCDVLRQFEIDPDEQDLIYENNLKILGII